MSAVVMVTIASQLLYVIVMYAEQFTKSLSVI